MKRRSDRLRDRGRVGSVTTVGCSHSPQDAAGGTRAPRRRGQVDDDRFALDSTLLVIVADGEARDAVVILAAGDDARPRDHGGGRSEIIRDPVAEVRSTSASVAVPKFVVMVVRRSSPTYKSSVGAAPGVASGGAAAPGTAASLSLIHI